MIGVTGYCTMLAVVMNGAQSGAAATTASPLI